MQARIAQVCSLVALFGSGVVAIAGQELPRADDHAAKVIATAAGVSLATARSNIDAVVLRNTIQPNQLKGGFGEEHMNRYLARHLGRHEGWTALQARIGSQGIDGLSIQTDAEGKPTGLRVSEVKYGSSRLKLTADGIQMGKPWRDRRLAAMGRNYRSIAAAVQNRNMAIAGPGGSIGKQRVQIALPGSRKAAVFARSASDKPWEFVGPRRLLDEAGLQADRIGSYLERAGRGEVAYESFIYRTRIKDGVLHVRIKDAGRLGVGVSEAGLATRGEFKVLLTDRQLANGIAIARGEIARQLRAQGNATSVADANAHAKRIIGNERDLAEILEHRHSRVGLAIARSSVGIGGAAALIDVVAQAGWDYATTGRVRWREATASGGIVLAGTAIGATAGQATTALLARSPAAQQLLARSSATLGIGSARLLSRGIGGAVGGGVTSVLLAAGGYMTGAYDASTATRVGVGGVSSGMVGAAAGWGILSVATTFGTASTGTAIASLHGAAATSASMAWLGGGTVAAGGFGAAGGVVVITGGVAVVAIGAGVLINYGFAYWDERTDLHRIELTIARLARKTNFVATGPPAHGFVTTRIGAH